MPTSPIRYRDLDPRDLVDLPTLAWGELEVTTRWRIGRRQMVIEHLPTGLKQGAEGERVSNKDLKARILPVLAAKVAEHREATRRARAKERRLAAQTGAALPILVGPTPTVGSGAMALEREE